MTVVGALFAALLLSMPGLHAAPMTVKELQFLIRQGASEAEIVREAASRRLLAPLDNGDVTTLKKSGATDSLIAKLRMPGIALDQKEAEAEIRRQAENKAKLDASLAEDAAMRAAREKQWNQAAEQLREAHTTQGWLNGKLFRLHGQDLKPIEMRLLAGTRIFGFYFASMASGPSRDFTPQLVAAYNRLKNQYGDDFEIVFISGDRDEFNQKEFIRSYRMPWPTMKLGRVDESISQFGGDRLPWFVLVSDTGKALTVNGVDKRYVEPSKVLDGLEQLLENMRH